jgi:hypothetical protein
VKTADAGSQTAAGGKQLRYLGIMGCLLGDDRRVSQNKEFSGKSIGQAECRRDVLVNPAFYLLQTLWSAV